MDDQAKRLGLMKFWLFGTFTIIWTAMTVYVGGAIGTGMAIFGERNYWIAVVVAVFILPSKIPRRVSTGC